MKYKIIETSVDGGASHQKRYNNLVQAHAGAKKLARELLERHDGANPWRVVFHIVDDRGIFQGKVIPEEVTT